MGISTLGKLVCLFLICIAAPRNLEAAISCTTVMRNLSPCITYVQNGGSLSGTCCKGAQSLNQAASTTPDVQAACKCIKTIVPMIKAKVDLINSLPEKCGIVVPYKYDPMLDCNTVNR